MTLPLETGVIYGPLYSRRLGLSLGVNLLPVNYKSCSFNCIYCHYGLSDTNRVIRNRDFPSVVTVVREVELALHSPMRFDTLTFSGNGEPTLHPHFIEIVGKVRELVNRIRPEVTMSLYSNASTVTQMAVRAVLHEFDNPILKLDCGDQQTFAKVNQPSGDISLFDIMDGLKQIPHLIIQSLLIGGPVNNSTPQTIEKWQVALADIRPAKVQLYSCDYPVPIDTVERVLPYVLKRIATETEKHTGIQVEPYWIT